ncbi:hypothetical protein [Halorubrum sp. C191]|uniref:hypothetical protein n=1 Tax=Halorubrum sp. C191 TaxID=1383842 RepID=UPI0013041822|nr:hypothetical protein [Halorubrum sp. C191]
MNEREAFEKYATEQIQGTKLEYRKGRIGWLAVPEPKMWEMNIERDLRVEVNEDWIENQ